MVRTAAATNTENPLVFMQTDEGFKVYAPANPKASFQVSGSADAPTCTCPEFQNGSNGARCAHIRAVERLLPASNDAEEEAYAREERLAIQEEGDGMAHAGDAPEFPLPRAQMMIKRSVSRDGRIDSVSVEFTQLLNGETQDDVRGHAERILALQEEIVGQFKSEGHGNGNGDQHEPDPQDEESALDAKLLGIEGMNTRVGWRLFMNVMVDSETVKMFGKQEDLANAIRNAGYPDAAKKRITQGLKLNLRCRVITSKSEDGRYTVIDRVLPPTGSAR